jgi:ParB family chromosome partitioning protein
MLRPCAFLPAKKMEFKFGTVGLDRINSEDTRYRITSNAVSPQLLISIQQVGLINPPVLLQCPLDYRIVSGFNRIAACRRLNVTAIHARILDTDTSSVRCIQIAIADNASQRSLDLVEQARCVELLSLYYADPVQLVDAARSLGLAVNIDMAGKLRKLAGMNDLLKAGVLDGSIALPVALQLESLNEKPISNELAVLLKELDLSLNRQREVLDWVLSICRRDNIDGTQLLLSGRIDEIRQDRELDRRQKSQYIRDYLKKCRFPSIERHEDRFARTVNQLGLSKGTHLIAPQNFESPFYSLKFDFQSRQDLLDKLHEFEHIVNTKNLNILWDDFNSK